MFRTGVSLFRQSTLRNFHCLHDTQGTSSVIILSNTFTDRCNCSNAVLLEEKETLNDRSDDADSTANIYKYSMQLYTVQNIISCSYSFTFPIRYIFGTSYYGEQNVIPSFHFPILKCIIRPDVWYS